MAPGRKRELPAELENELTAIAKDYLHIDTLRTRNWDTHDFHEVSVWGLKDALHQAYLLGRKAAKEKK